MGASPSKPAPATAPSTSEKQQTAIASLSAHHAADRLARIQAEQHRNGRWESPRYAPNPHASEDDGNLKLDSVAYWDRAAQEHPVTRIASLTLHGSDIAATVRRREAEIANSHVFNHKISVEGSPITNQKSSGRCWLFASTNIIRLEVMKKLNMSEFELSQGYLSFFDGLEKANFLLENNIDLVELPLNDRVLSSLIGPGGTLNQGGQFSMLLNLVKKYGVVPQAVYPESFSSSAYSKIGWLLTLKLREYVLELRALHAKAHARLEAAGSTLSQEERKNVVVKQLRLRKDEQMAEVYRIMVIALGNPPKPHERFSFDYYDKDGKAHTLSSTPLDFFRDYSGAFEGEETCSLVDDPRNPKNKLITVTRLGNVWNSEPHGNPVLYVNTTIETMKQGVVDQIKSGKPVFFGCDVGQFSHTPSGIMDTDLFGYEEIFGIKLGLSKADRLNVGESSMTHAMLITGVHLDAAGKPVRYRVENSWGPDAGQKGYMTMTDAWFDQFVYQVAIRKKFVAPHLWKLHADGVTDRTIVLPPYDPFGALAQ